MRHVKHYGAAAQTVAQGRLKLKDLLLNARTLDSFTPHMLAHCYKVPLREAETMLSAENARRDRMSI